MWFGILDMQLALFNRITIVNFGHEELWQRPRQQAHNSQSFLCGQNHGVGERAACTLIVSRRSSYHMSRGLLNAP